MSEIRTPANRLKLWNETVHFANEQGRPACGSAKRTHSSWMTPTTDDVTCKRCIAMFGSDNPTPAAAPELEGPPLERQVELADHQAREARDPANRAYYDARRQELRRRLLVGETLVSGGSELQPGDWVRRRGETEIGLIGEIAEDGWALVVYGYGNSATLPLADLELQPSLAETLERIARIEAERTAKIRELNAELELLERFDSIRELAGHDYGSGQRRAELSRRRNELVGYGVVDRLALRSASGLELAAAWARVGAPRIARIEAENYRRETPATRRTLATWRKIERWATTPPARSEAAAVSAELYDDATVSNADYGRLVEEAAQADDARALAAEGPSLDELTPADPAACSELELEGYLADLERQRRFHLDAREQDLIRRIGALRDELARRRGFANFREEIADEETVTTYSEAARECAECGHLHFEGVQLGYSECPIEGCGCQGQTWRDEPQVDEIPAGALEDRLDEVEARIQEMRVDETRWAIRGGVELPRDEELRDEWERLYDERRDIAKRLADRAPLGPDAIRAAARDALELDAAERESLALDQFCGGRDAVEPLREAAALRQMASILADNGEAGYRFVPGSQREADATIIAALSFAALHYADPSMLIRELELRGVTDAAAIVAKGRAKLDGELDPGEERERLEIEARKRSVEALQELKARVTGLALEVVEAELDRRTDELSDTRSTFDRQLDSFAERQASAGDGSSV